MAHPTRLPTGDMFFKNQLANAFFTVFFCIAVLAGLQKINAHLGFGFVLVLILSPLLGVQAYLTLNQIRLLAAIDPFRRQTFPMSALICLIPMIGIVWNFILVERISNSLRLEFEFRGFDSTDEQFGRNLGKSWSRYSVTTRAVFEMMWLTNYFAETLSYFELLILPLATYSLYLITGVEYAYVLNAHREHLWGKGVAHRTEEQKDYGDG